MSGRLERSALGSFASLRPGLGHVRSNPMDGRHCARGRDRSRLFVAGRDLPVSEQLYSGEQVARRKNSENPKRFFGVGRIGRDTGAVHAAVLDLPFEGIPAENEDAPVVLTVRVKSALARHDAQSAAAEPGIEIEDTSCHLHATALECGAELVVEFDDLSAIVCHRNIREVSRSGEAAQRPRDATARSACARSEWAAAQM